MKRLPGEPEGYRELCAQLRREKNPRRFSALLNEINTLLAEHARRTAMAASCGEQPQEARVPVSSSVHIALTHQRE
jgi:hypothetical protein